MKKLVIAAVAIAMSVVANAASIKWQTSYEVGNGTETGFTSATMAYLIDSAALSQTAIYDAVMGGASLADAVEGNYIKAAAMSEGAIATQNFTAYNTGDTVKAYMVLFDSDLNALYFSEEISKKMPATGSANYMFESNSSIDAVMADMSSFSAADGGWVQTVPEPTSGLLMLLGMAGLALRRRRA